MLFYSRTDSNRPAATAVLVGGDIFHRPSAEQVPKFQQRRDFQRVKSWFVCLGDSFFCICRAAARFYSLKLAVCSASAVPESDWRSKATPHEVFIIACCKWALVSYDSSRSACSYGRLICPDFFRDRLRRRQKPTKHWHLFLVWLFVCTQRVLQRCPRETCRYIVGSPVVKFMQ